MVVVYLPTTPQTLPDLSLTTLNGSTEQFETRNVPTVVYLWATDCGACTGDFSLLADAARYGGFRYLFVNQGNDKASVRRYLEANGLTDVAKSVYLDPANRVYDALEPVRAVIARPDRLEHTLEPLLGRP